MMMMLMVMMMVMMMMMTMLMMMMTMLMVTYSLHSTSPHSCQEATTHALQERPFFRYFLGGRRGNFSSLFSMHENLVIPLCNETLYIYRLFAMKFYI